MRIKSLLVISIIVVFCLAAACSPYKARKAYLDYKFWSAGMKENTVQLENSTMHYWTGGEGPTLVLIQGFGADALWQWFGQVGDLSEKYSLVVPDLLWFGQSYSDKEDYSLNFQIENIKRLLDYLGVDKFHVLGVSYGGLVAYQLADDFPERVLTLIIEDSPGGAYTQKDYDRMLEVFEADDIVDIIIPEKPEDIKRLTAIAYYDPPYMPDFALKDVYENMFTGFVDHKVRLLEYMLENKEELSRLKFHITQKTLIIWGSDDPLFPLEVAERLKDSIGENAQLKVIEKTRHAPNMERPKEFNRLVLEFLAAQQ